MNNPAQEQHQFITTSIGNIAVYINEVATTDLPIIFLHGVYFDHHLWDHQIEHLNHRTTIAIDMPLHGNSRTSISSNWTLDDCAIMLLEILDSLHLKQVIAVGHSWGSMTILRAASKFPQRFSSIGFCNMPFLAASKKQESIFAMQHALLMFRNFYTRQTAKFLFGKSSLKNNPMLLNQLKRTMGVLTKQQIIQIDEAVIIKAKDVTDLIRNLTVKAIAIKGKEDYVPIPPRIKIIVVEGGHVSPLKNHKRC
ncbi:alpha/beta hydrolase [Flavobacterium phycosphaerae]|uniref:alpha/beta hydrolase n=1 Tax=Flavobacterium phycosphaerae TaxID=2697515 RepID=UPI001389AB9C|nr:alpha/beta hydrolase [Flavobacterium phycosphaerae]